MARSNVHGKCQLCLKRRKLSRSYYLGRVLHILRRDAKGHPVVMTPKVIKATPKQLLFVVRISETSLAPGPSYGLSFSSTLGF
jgi:hypothetical protein